MKTGCWVWTGGTGKRADGWYGQKRGLKKAQCSQGLVHGIQKVGLHWPSFLNLSYMSQLMCESKSPLKISLLDTKHLKYKQNRPILAPSDFTPQNRNRDRPCLAHGVFTFKGKKWPCWKSTLKWAEIGMILAQIWISDDFQCSSYKYTKNESYWVIIHDLRAHLLLFAL